MRTYLLSTAAVLALFTIATSALSKEIHIAPGGVKMGASSGHHRYYNRLEGLYDRYESERCSALRPVCTHNCRRFREFCD
jgi:hypothetical protein